MKKLLMLFCAGVLISALCVGCNEFKQERQQPKEFGLGEEIPGMEIQKATGTVIGNFQDHGYGSWFLQVDEEFPVGESLEYTKPERPIYYYLPESGTYKNVIQVQRILPIKTGDKISFSFREYLREKDLDLFIRGDGTTTADHVGPSCPMYVITEYKILNN